MKKIIIAIAIFTALVSCKKENDDYVDLKDQVLFVVKKNSPSPTYLYKYEMLSSAQKRIINGQTEFYRTPYSVYTNKFFWLDTYYKAPLDKSDSVTVYTP